MKRKWFILVAGITIVLVAMMGCVGPAAPPVTKEPVKIAVFGAETGAVKPLADNIRAGAHLAEHVINEAGGILGGRPVKLIEYDEGYSAEVVIASMKEAIADGCIAFTGYDDASTTLPAVDFAEKHNIPICGNGCIDRKAVPGVYQGFWRCHAGLAKQSMGGFITWVGEQGYKRAVIVRWVGDYSKNASDWAHYYTETGRCGDLRIVDEIWHPWGQVDITNEVTKAYASDPDIIITGGMMVDSIVPAINRLNELGYEGAFSIEWSSLDDGVVAREGGEVVNGVLSYTGFWRNPEIEETVEFLDAFKEYAHEVGLPFDQCSVFGVYGYSCVVSLVKAIELAGSTEPNAIIEALPRIDWMTPYGVKFERLPGGQIYTPHQYILEARNGEVELLGTSFVPKEDFGPPYIAPGAE